MNIGKLSGCKSLTTNENVKKYKRTSLFFSYLVFFFIISFFPSRKKAKSNTNIVYVLLKCSAFSVLCMYRECNDVCVLLRLMLCVFLRFNISAQFPGQFYVLPSLTSWKLQSEGHKSDNYLLFVGVENLVLKKHLNKSKLMSCAIIIIQLVSWRVQNHKCASASCKNIISN